jgi:hypothetical protein
MTVRTGREDSHHREAMYNGRSWGKNNGSVDQAKPSDCGEFDMAKKNGTEGAAATQAGQAASGKPATKIEAVRRAIADKGRGIKPLQICEYLKQKWDIDISPDVASNYKKAYLRGSKKKKKRKGARKQPVAAAQETPSQPRPAATSKAVAADFRVEDVRTLRDMAARMGATKLCSLVDAMFR